MIFQQFRHEHGGCLSYLIGCTQREVCAVIDAQSDPNLYLDYAAAHHLRITHIFETHSQADHLSGSRRLSELTGAPVFFHESVRAGFPVKGLNDGQEITLGNIILKILHTPGHTSDSISILVSDSVRTREPWMVFTGDTLFVGDTGRPDLDGDAGLLHDSIWKKLLVLHDAVEIYPTHYAGSTCGKMMSPKPSSTIGFERRFNPALRFVTKDEFVRFVEADLPVQPPRFQLVRRYNLGFLEEPPIDRMYERDDLELTPRELQAKMARGEPILLLDVREKYERELATIGGAFIPLGQLPKRCGELEAEKEIVVYCHHGIRSRQAVEFLYENGFSSVKTLKGGITAWSMEVDPTVPRY
ncbi:MAG TPA: MBL fold metallo-hydrolase [Bacteroidota bacterium]|nr:MBL fold metallo-hydrolase [Bacteroidota bacterium]